MERAEGRGVMPWSGLSHLNFDAALTYFPLTALPDVRKVGPHVHGQAFLWGMLQNVALLAVACIPEFRGTNPEAHVLLD